jgi:hypothetical protein
VSSLTFNFWVVIVTLKADLKLTWFTITNTLKYGPLMNCIITHAARNWCWLRYFEQDLVSELTFYAFLWMTLSAKAVDTFVLFADPVVNIFSLTALQTVWLFYYWLLQHTFMEFFNTVCSIWTFYNLIMCFAFFKIGPSVFFRWEILKLV